MASDHEYQIVPLHFGASEEIGECGGIENAPCWVKQYLSGTGVFRPGVRAMAADLRHVYRREMVGAADVIGGEGVGVGIFRLPFKVEENLHSGGTGIVLASRQSRSSE